MVQGSHHQIQAVMGLCRFLSRPASSRSYAVSLPRDDQELASELSKPKYLHCGGNLRWTVLGGGTKGNPVSLGSLRCFLATLVVSKMLTCLVRRACFYSLWNFHSGRRLYMAAVKPQYTRVNTCGAVHPQ